MSSKDVRKVKVSQWYMDIEPTKYISVRGVVILAELPYISRRMPVECSSVYHRIFVVLLWSSGQHIDVHSFRSVPVQITVGLNTSIEFYCRMWLLQQSSIGEYVLFWFWGRSLYEMFIIFLIEFKMSPDLEMCLVFKYLQFMFESHILE